MPRQTNYAEQKSTYINHNDNEAKQKHAASNAISLINIWMRITRSSADADNRLDAFSGQSRSTNMVPFHM